MRKTMVARLRRLTATLLVSGLLVAATPAVSGTDAFCDRFPWFPGCRTAVVGSPLGAPSV